jgi:hypothetical protein
MMAHHRGDIERRGSDGGHHHKYKRLFVLMVRMYVNNCVKWRHAISHFDPKEFLILAIIYQDRER